MMHSQQQNERSRAGAYGVLPYFLSKLIAELPFSALFPSIFGVIVYKIAGLNPAPDRLVKFLSIITVSAVQ
jgi:ABC-2 type transporter